MNTRSIKFWKLFFQFITYTVVGTGTVLVAYGTRWIILNVYSQIYGLDLESTDLAMVGGSSVLRSVAQSLGWVAGLLFSFMPYKFIVFHNKEWGWKPIRRQFLRFVISRILCYFLELLLAVGLPVGLQGAGYQTFMLFGEGGIPMTADNLTMVISVLIVTAINFPIGKLIVFNIKPQKAVPAPCEKQKSTDVE